MADIRIIPSAGAINVTGSADFRGTGGSSILFLTGSGQIGVGTTVPESELHIVSSGTRFITLDRTGTRSYDLGVNSAGTMLVTDNTVSADRISLSHSGSVGIGTTNPTQLLHLVNASGPVIRLVRSSNRFDIEADTNSAGIVSRDSATANFSITGFGSVGVGTSSPTRALHVVGEVRFSSYGAGTVTGTAARSLAVDSSGNIIEVANSSLAGSGTANRVAYWTDSNTIAADADFFFDGTSVGIGTTSPSQRLSVEGGSIVVNAANAAANYYLYLNKKQGQDGGILFQRDSNNEWQVANISTTGDLIFYSYGTSTEAVVFQKASGNVGIGNTSPNQKLVVAGNIAVSASNNEGAIWLGDGQSVGLSRSNSYDLVLAQEASSGNPLYLAGAGDVIVSIDSNNNETGRKFIVGSNAVKASNELFSVNESGNVYVSNDLTVDGKITAREFHTSFVSASIIYQSGSTQFGNSSDDKHIFTGNVGIGTTTVNKLLVVAGDAWINRPTNKVDNNGATEFGSRVEFNGPFTAASSSYMVFRYPTYDNFLIGGDYDGNIGGAIPNIQFGRSNGTVYMHIASSDGNVGIGTTAPGGKLDVRGTSYFRGSSLGVTVAPSATGADMYFYEGGNPVIYLQSSGSIIFNNGHNVGIGTNSPASKLDILIPSSHTTAGLFSNSGINLLDPTTVGAYSQITFGYTPSRTFAAAYLGYISTNSSSGGLGALVFGTRNVTTDTQPTERMRITSDGNVGIGLTNPSRWLTVLRAGAGNGTQQQVAQFANIATGATSAAIYIGATTGTDWLIGKNIYGASSLTNFQIGDQGVSTSYFDIVTGGNVGIGTTNPVNRLQVAGGVTATSFTGSLQGDITGNAATATALQTARTLTIGATGKTFDGTGNVSWTLGEIGAQAAGSYLTAEADTLSSVTGRGASTSTASSFNNTLTVAGGGNTLTLVKGIGNAAIAFAGTSDEATGLIESVSGGGLKFYSRTGSLASPTGFDSFNIKNGGDAFFNYNVGIGTTVPGAKLEVYSGTSRFWHGSTTYYTQFDNSNEINTYTSAGAISTMYLNFQTGGDVNIARNAIVAQSAGNVGIGSTSPAYKLDVAGDIQVRTSDPLVILQPTSGTYAFLQKLSTSNGNFLRLYDGTDYSMFWIGANVGIGTTNPTNRLQVAGGVTATSFTGSLQGNITGTAASETLDTVSDRGATTNQTLIAGGFKTQGDIGVTQADGDFLVKLYQSSADGSIELFTGEPTPISRVKISSYGNSYINPASSGNVGIGTTNPSQILDIVGTTPIINIQAGANNNARGIQFNYNGAFVIGSFLSFGATGENALSAGATGTNGYFLTFKTDGTEHMRITPGGNVGIGTTSPSYKLDVNGITRGTSFYAVNDRNQFARGFLRLTSATNNTSTLDISVEDTVTSIYSNYYGGGADQPIRIGTYANLTNQLYLATSGNVGIGTTNPVNRLQVAGGVTATSFTGSLQGNITGTAASETLATVTGRGASTSQSITLSNTSPLAFTGNSNSATYTLSAIYVNQNNTSGATANGIFIERGRLTDSASAEIRYFVIGARGGQIQWQLSGDGGTAQTGGALIAGSVGIGTTSPQVELHVKGNNGWGEVRIEGQSFSGGNGGAVEFYSEGTALADMYSDTTKNLIFRTNGSAERMRITSAGNVSIGSSNTDPLSLGRERNLAIVTTGTNATLTLVGGGAGRIDFGVNTTRTAGIYSDATNYTEIFTSTALPLLFSTNSTEKMRLTSDGNLLVGATNADVGGSVKGAIIRQNGSIVGATNIASPFHYQTPISADRMNTQGDGIMYSMWRQGVFQAGIGAASGQIMTFFTGDNSSATERMRINSSGNVGIGTSGPLGGKLHVYNSTGIFEGPSSGASVINSNTFGIQVGPTHNRDATSGVYFPGVAFNHLLNYNGGTTYNVAPQGWIGLRLVDTPGSERSSLVFATKEGTGTTNAGTDIPTERMCITPFGNVYINATNGSYPTLGYNLGVRGASSQAFISIARSGQTLDSDGLIVGLDSTTGYVWLRDNINLTFGTNNSAKVTILAAGNVGIGTTSPSQRLSVEGGSIVVNAANATANYYLFLNKKQGQDGGILFQRDSNNEWQVANTSTTGNLVFYSYGTSTEAVVFQKASGNVGIGSVSPAFKLDVTGAIRATGDVLAFSDARVKENVVTLENSLDLVQKLRGVRYNRIGESDNKIGVIAQEVLEVLPEVVQQDQEGTYSVAYGNITALLIEAIKQQQLQIDELKLEIKQLKG